MSDQAALYADWGRRLRAARIDRGLTQHDLANATGLSQALISMAERGGTGLGDESRRALARALGTAPSRLFPYPEDAAVAP